MGSLTTTTFACDTGGRCVGTPVVETDIRMCAGHVCSAGACTTGTYDELCSVCTGCIPK
jgi:hypothetical protein